MTFNRESLQLQNLLSPRERTINELTSLAEVFRKKAIKQPLKDTFGWFGYNKKIGKEFGHYLKTQWQNFEMASLEKYLDALTAKGYIQTKKEVTHNIMVYAYLRLHTEALKNLKIEHAKCFDGSHSKYLADLIERYVSAKASYTKSKLIDEIKIIIKSFHIPCLEHYSAKQFRLGVNQNQIFLLNILKKNVGKLQEFANTSENLEKQIDEFIESLNSENTQKITQCATFNTLYLKFSDFFNKLTSYPVMQEFLHSGKEIIALIKRLEELKDNLIQLNLTKLNMTKIPFYGIDFLDDQGFDVIDDWAKSAAIKFQSLKPVVVEPIIKPKEIKPTVHTPALITEKKETQRNFPDVHDSPFVAKQLDSATSYYLIRLYKILPENNWNLVLMDENREVKNIKEVINQVLKQYRMKGTIPVNTLYNLFHTVAKHFDKMPEAQRPLNLVKKLDVAKSFLYSVHKEEEDKEDYGVKFFVKSNQPEPAFFQSYREDLHSVREMKMHDLYRMS